MGDVNRGDGVWTLDKVVIGAEVAWSVKEMDGWEFFLSIRKRTDDLLTVMVYANPAGEPLPESPEDSVGKAGCIVKVGTRATIDEVGRAVAQTIKEERVIRQARDKASAAVQMTRPKGALLH